MKKIAVLLFLNILVNPMKQPNNSPDSFARIIGRMQIGENTSDLDILQNPEIQAELARGGRGRATGSSRPEENTQAIEALSALLNNLLLYNEVLLR